MFSNSGLLTLSGITATSGNKRPIALPGYVLQGTSLPPVGYDFHEDGSYIPKPPRPEQCRADCANNTSCVGYVMRRPGYGSPWTCRLLSTVTKEDPVWYFDSGYVGTDWF